MVSALVISSERVVQELEKIFQSPIAKDALDAFAMMPGLPKNNEYFYLFQKMALGSQAFLWAGYLFSYSLGQAESIMNRLRLPNTLKVEVLYLLGFVAMKTKKLDFCFHSKVDEHLRFEFTVKLALVEKFKKLFGEYDSPGEKLRILGYGGHYFIKRGIVGKPVGRALEMMEAFALDNPTASVFDFQRAAERVAEIVDV